MLKYTFDTGLGRWCCCQLFIVIFSAIECLKMMVTPVRSENECLWVRPALSTNLERGLNGLKFSLEPESLFDFY